jgi:hypothetical protein
MRAEPQRAVQAGEAQSLHALVREALAAEA